MKMLIVLLAMLAAAPSFAQADDCAGIVPTLGDPSEVTIYPPSGETCNGATTDQNGVLAVESHDPYSSHTWRTFDSSGNPLGSFVTVLANAYPGDQDIVPQASGFEGLWRDPRAFGGLYLDRYDVDGTVLSSTLLGGDMCGGNIYRSAETGSLTLTGCYLRSPSAAFLEVFDPNGVMTGSGQAGDNTQRRAAVGDELGHNLVVYFPGTNLGFPARSVVAQWFDDNAVALTDPFYVATASSDSSTIKVRSLIGGGAALRVDDAWVAAIDSGSPAVGAPPQFLADHPGWDFYVVRGRMAYALVSPTAASSFGGHMPLYSAAGNRCGAVDFPGLYNLQVGADGTVIGQGSENGCTKRYWPALLSAPLP